MFVAKYFVDSESVEVVLSQQSVSEIFRLKNLVDDLPWNRCFSELELFRLVGHRDFGDVAGAGAGAADLTGEEIREKLASAVLSSGVLALPNYSWVLGVVGGTTALGTLAERRRSLVSELSRNPQAEGADQLALALCEVAAAELNLLPDSSLAVDALCQVLVWNSRLVRHRALLVSVRQLMRSLALGTVALRRLGAAVLSGIDLEDLEEFSLVAPWMYRNEPEKVMSRCLELLSSPGVRSRELAMRTLLLLVPMVDSYAKLREHFESETDARLSLGLVRQLRKLLSTGSIAALIERTMLDPCPYVRLLSLSVLGLVSDEQRQMLVRAYLEVEVEPILRELVL